MSRKNTVAGIIGSLLLAFVVAPILVQRAHADEGHPAAMLRAGAVAIDISPTQFPVIINGNFLPGQATTVHDPLHARCLVLDDGKTRLAICVVDSCVLPGELLNEAKKVASQSTGIPPDHMVISATHAHSCPSAMGALGTDPDPNYPPLLLRRLVEAIESANRNLAPAKVAWGIGKAADYTGARRWIRRPDRMLRDPYGEISMRANMHPGYQSTDAIGPSGPIDPDLTVLSVQSCDGRPVALLANFGMHYFATGVKAVSADYFGLFCEKVGKLLNADESHAATPPFVAMLSQGCSGDMWRVNYDQPKKEITIDQYAADLAKIAVDAVVKSPHRGDVSLAMVETNIRIKARLADAKRMEWATKVLADMGDRKPKNNSEVLAREVIYLSQKPEAEMKLSAIRIGDFGIVAIPNEVYALSGLKIKAQSPLPATMVIELANDELGYIPPPEQHKLGGYTTWAARSSYSAVDTEPRMVDTVVGLLEQVSTKPRRSIVAPVGAYATDVLSSKPVAFWRLAEMNGPRASDATENGNHGAYEDGVVFFLEGPQSPAFCGENIVHRAAHFCGGRMTGDIKALNASKVAYTAELWFWNGLANEARGVTGYLFGRGPAGDTQNPSDWIGIGGTEPQNGDDAKGRLIVSAGLHKHALIGRSIVAPRTWNHLVLVREGSRATVYLNGEGEPEIIGEVEAPPPLDSHVFVGGRNDFVDTLEGKIDEVAIYDRALAREEVARHFHAAAIDVRPVSAAATPAHTNVVPTLPTPPQDSVKRMHIRDGFQAELMVSEPMLTSPVAMAFGPDGKLWVIEMTEYPLGKKGTMDPSGRVIYLESTHNDGKYDKTTVFAENLNFPNGILPWRKGVIVTSAPDILYLEDTTGTGKPADKKEVLYTGFTQGNPQLRINCPTYGLDNCVYLANGLSSRDVARSIKTGATVSTSGHDLRIRPDEGAIEPEAGMSQYGRRMDNWGTWLGEHNSFPVRHFIIRDRYANRNKDVQLPRGYDDAGLPPNPKVYPVSAGQKRYGYAFFEQAGHFTSACSLTPYRDDLLFGPLDPSRDFDHVFVCEPAHNLVQHLVLNPTGSTFAAERAAGEEFNEFLASEDGWCRPCFLSSGPDGALWMVDIYRYFIDHPDFLPPEGKQDMRPFYRLGDTMGRIYRLYPKGKTPRAIPRLDRLSTPQLVAALDSSNGWQRDMAQMMLVWQKDPAAVAPLEHLATDCANPLARMHAICALDGIGKLSPRVLEGALLDSNGAVRRQAVRLAETYAAHAPELVTSAVKLVNDPEPLVRLQLAFTLGEWSDAEAGEALGKIAVDAGNDIYLSAAVLSSATHHYEAIANALIASNKASPMTRDLLAMALARKNRDVASRLLAPVFAVQDGRYQAGQLEAFARFMDDLTQHHATLAKLAAEKRDALAERLSQATPLFAAARVAAKSTDSDPQLRIAAISVLGRDEAHAADDVALLDSLLAPSNPPTVRIATIHSLARFTRDDIPSMLLRGWRDDPSAVRLAALDAIIAREPWAFDLLKRIDAHEMSGADIDPTRRQRLIRHASPRVRELADKTIGESSALSRNKVLENYRATLDLAGDFARGEKVFAANCTTCHHLGKLGQEIGPNLQSVAAWPADALMVAILDPSRSAEPRYLGFNCMLDSGETVYGLVTSESSAGVTIKGIDGKDRVIPRSQIKSLECTNRSLMPDGLEAAIDKQSLADLIKFLQSQGK